jgi:acyl-CoA thioesterase-1
MRMAARPTFIVAICIWLAAISTACAPKSQSSDAERAPVASGSPQPAAPPAAPQPASAPDSRPVVVTFGDSLTQGVSGKSYPAFLQDLLDQGGFSYRVDNQGVSGDTSTDGLARIENVVAAKPALVVLEFGGNDGLRGVPVETTRANLDQMLARLKSAGIPVVLAGITLPPNYGPDYVKPFTAVYPDLARKYKLRYLPFLLIHVYDKPGMMRPDGIHPTEEGNRIVAQDVFDLIRPLLRKST